MTRRLGRRPTFIAGLTVAWASVPGGDPLCGSPLAGPHRVDWLLGSTQARRPDRRDLLRR